MPIVHHIRPLYDVLLEGDELAVDDTHRYVVLWQIFNLRLVAVSLEERGRFTWDYAWCYPQDPEIVRAAVRAWNPDTQDEPAGWHKRPGSRLRLAPHRDQEPAYNRPRCDHGSYIHEGCRIVGCPEVQEEKHV